VEEFFLFRESEEIMREKNIPYPKENTPKENAKFLRWCLERKGEKLGMSGRVKIPPN
jgi:hypothetical protein